MSDNDGKKTLGVRSGPRASNVKQSFSHGRSKNVVVETKRKRVVVPKAGLAKSSIQTSSKDGGRVIAVTSMDKLLGKALEKSYKTISKIEFEGKNFRNDIGFDL